MHGKIVMKYSKNGLIYMIQALKENNKFFKDKDYEQIIKKLEKIKKGREL